MKDLTLPDFLMIPRQLIEDRTIQNLDRMVYGCIYWFTKLKNERCTASNATFGQLLDARPGSIADALVRLEAAGYIKRTYKDEAKRNRQEIIALVTFSKIKRGDTANAVTSKQNDTANAVTRDTANEEQNKKVNNKKNIASDSLAGEEKKKMDEQIAEIIHTFESFNVEAVKWYGNKTQRKAAQELIETLGYEKTLEVVRAIPALMARPFCPQAITTPFELKKNLTKLVAFTKQARAVGAKNTVMAV